MRCGCLKLEMKKGGKIEDSVPKIKQGGAAAPALGQFESQDPHLPDWSRLPPGEYLNI